MDKFVNATLKTMLEVGKVATIVSVICVSMVIISALLIFAPLLGLILDLMIFVRIYINYRKEKNNV